MSENPAVSEKLAGSEKLVGNSSSASRWSPRDRRLLLAIAGAAVCWRWLVAQRTPAIGVDAVHDLFVAQQLAAFGLGSLVHTPREPLWAIVLAPFVAAGLPATFAARLVASLCGGIAVLVSGLAAERLREGAGLPAALLTAAAGGSVAAAGAGSGAALLAVLVAAATFAAAGRNWCIACAWLLPAVLAGGDVVAALAVGGTYVGLWPHPAPLPILLLVPLGLLAPRTKTVAVLALAAASLAAVALLCGAAADVLPTWAPLFAALAGVGLARVPRLPRELLLAAAVLAEGHAGWQLVEPVDAAAEPALGRALVRLHPDTPIVTDRPRVLFGAGQRPQALPAPEIPARVRPDAIVVLGPAAQRDATLRSLLAASHQEAGLSLDLREALDRLGVVALVPRPR